MQFTSLEVPPKCFLETPSYFIYRKDDLSVQLDPEPMSYEWSLPPLDWLASSTDIDSLETAVEQLEAMQIPDITTGSVQHLHSLQRPLIHNYPLTSTMVVSWLAFLLVVGLILAICIQTRRHRLAAKRINDPFARYQELLTKNENVEALLELIKDKVQDDPNA